MSNRSCFSSPRNNIYQKRKSQYPARKRTKDIFKENEQKTPRYIKLEKDAVTEKPKISVEASSLLLLIKYFLDKGLLKVNDLKQIINKQEKEEVQFVITDDLSKEELRALWLHQMRHHELFCSICGNEITSTKGNSDLQLTYEHRIPKSKGGKTDGKNGDPAHAICNRLKTDYLPQVWEKIGYVILTMNGINVNLNKCRYNYITENIKRAKANVK